MSKSPKTASTPKTPNPWDPLPILNIGDSDASELYRAIGQALTVWERLDDNIGILFAVLVNSRQGAAEAAFGMVQSIEQQLRMVSAAADRIYPKIQNAQTLEMEAPPIRTEIAQLINDLVHLAGCRNNIAHGIVTHFQTTSTDKDGVSTETDHGVFLIPGHTNTKKRPSSEHQLARLQEHGFDRAPQHLNSYAYTAAQVNTFANHFEDYRKRSSALLMKIQEDLRQRWPPQAVRELEYESRIRELQTKLNSLERAQQPPPLEE